MCELISFLKPQFSLGKREPMHCFDTAPSLKLWCHTPSLVSEFFKRFPDYWNWLREKKLTIESSGFILNFDYIFIFSCVSSGCCCCCSLAGWVLVGWMDGYGVYNTHVRQIFFFFFVLLFGYNITGTILLFWCYFVS